MDPLSTIASVVALVQLVDALVGGLKLIGSFQDAPTEAMVLADELFGLQLVLQQITTIVQQQSTVPKPMADLLNTLILRTATSLKSLEGLLQKAIFKSGNGRMSRVAWIRHSDRINGLRTSLRDSKLSLSLLITSTTLSGVYSMADRLDSLEKDILPQMLLHQQAQAQLLNQMHDQQLLQASTRSAVTSGTTSGNTTSLSLTWNTTKPQSLRQLPPRAKRCRIACSCICHNPVKLNSAAVLTGLVGSLHVKYRELPGLAPTCNERSCQRQMGGSASLTYKFPPWLLQRIASVTFSPNFGLHFVLRAPRVVADDAPILRYAAVGDIQGIQKLISDGLASPGDVGASYGMTALHIAFVKKDIDLCKFLVQHHADPSYETSLRRSVIDIVRDEGINGKISDDLLSQLAVVFDEIDDYESFQLSPLHKSILGISPLDLEAQLSASTVYIDTPDSLGRTALSAAAWRGDAYAVQALLEYGASPNVCTPTELSPLHRAIESHSYECVDLLLKHGADVNHQNKRGRSPLHYACRIPDGSIAKLLLDHGANVNAEDHGCSQPLHESVVHKRMSQLELIFPHVNDIDSYSADGKTAVHLAICNDNVTGLQRLLDNGANFQNFTRHGSTSLHMAACSANPSTITALRHIDGLSLDVDHTNLAGATAADVLNLNPNDSPELRCAFVELKERLGTSDPGGASNASADAEDRFEDAVPYQ